MKEDKTEQHWDKLLHIRTSGRDDSHSDQYRYPYEPTPYTVLQRLADSGYIRKHNLLLDYGCGKGRVDFFLSWQTRCQSVGIEYDERIYENAQKNKEIDPVFLIVIYSMFLYLEEYSSNISAVLSVEPSFTTIKCQFL